MSRMVTNGKFSGKKGLRTFLSRKFRSIRREEERVEAKIRNESKPSVLDQQPKPAVEKKDSIINKIIYYLLAAIIVAILRKLFNI